MLSRSYPRLSDSDRRSTSDSSGPSRLGCPQQRALLVGRGAIPCIRWPFLPDWHGTSIAFLVVGSIVTVVGSIVTKGRKVDMNRFKTATAALLAASFIALQPVAALADGGQRRYGYEDERDRREEARDRREERRDRREEWRDRREDRRDRYEARHDRYRSDDRWNAGYGAWDPAPYYRADNRRYHPRRMSRADVIYRGSDDRYYCRRDDGTSGLIIGGIAGGVLGNVVARGRSKALGTIIGASAGAILGQSIDRGDIVCR
jgi:hypothetical protein